MPRNQTDATKASLNAQETSDAYTKLIAVKSNDGSGIARFTDDSVDTLFNTDTYTAYPFDLTLPDTKEGQETRARLTMTNVDRLFIEELRTATGYLFIDMWVIQSSTHDVMAHYPDMEMRSVTYDTMTVSGDLTYESFLAEPYPKDLMTARHFPGLFVA